MTGHHAPVRVLYIAGSGRSGSTLLTTVLGQLDGFFAAGELRYLWQRGLAENRPCGCGRAFRDCPYWTEVLAGVRLPMDGSAFTRSLLHRLRVLRTPLLLGRRAVGLPPLALAPADALIEDVYQALGDRPEVRVIVDSSKLPPYAALLEGLPDIELAVLHLVRDPRATAFSWQRRRQLDNTDAELMDLQPTAKAALLWLLWNSLTALLWARSPHYLRVRYEDFLRDPRRTLEMICGLVDERPELISLHSDDAVDLLPTHSVAGNPSRHRTGTVRLSADDEWRSTMKRGARWLVTMLTAPALLRCGYPLRIRSSRTTRSGRI